MKNFKKIAVVLAALMLITASATSCSGKKKVTESSQSMIEVSTPQASDEVGKNKVEAKIKQPVTVEQTTFTINNVIDINKSIDDGKYIYISYTIKNDSDKYFPTDALNNFCITIDGKVIPYDVRTNVYGLQKIKDYSTDFTVPAHGEASNYIGFVIPEGTKSFDMGYYATGNNNDKSNVVLCTITPDDYVSAPDGMMK